MIDPDQNASRQSGGSPGVQRLAIWEIMALVAGASLGIWLFLPGPGDNVVGPLNRVCWALFGILGGLSVVGPPLLMSESRRRRPWRAGKLIWFASGTASWLLWPPMVYQKVVRPGPGPHLGTSGICYFYGTPLMAIFVTLALLAGGRFRSRRRRTRRRSWRESFGLLLAALWACSGLYILWLIYSEDFRR